MKAKSLVTGILAALAMGISAGAAAQTQTRYFALVSASPITSSYQEFVFETADPALIARFERILAGPDPDGDVHIDGWIERGRLPYNSRWNFHIVPGTAGLFGNSIEVCDATAFEVEDNIETVPPEGKHWCPWESRLVREVKFDESSSALLHQPTARR